MLSVKLMLPVYTFASSRNQTERPKSVGSSRRWTGYEAAKRIKLCTAIANPTSTPFLVALGCIGSLRESDSGLQLTQTCTALQVRGLVFKPLIMRDSFVFGGK